MHGLGNDFVLLNKDKLLQYPAYKDIPQQQELARYIADRHTGLGCDQVIFYAERSNQDWEMEIINNDGTLATACGNATRCLAWLVAKEYGATTLRINVAGRSLKCKVEADFTVSVNMGRVSFEEPWMPLQSALWGLASHYKLELNEILCADVGNPHLVIFNNNLSEQDILLLGEVMQTHPLFPKGINVNFAKLENNDILLRVWERGTGLTLACGSGACATFAAAYKLGFAPSTAKIKFQLGELEMRMLNDDAHQVLMRGPVALVAKGTLYV